MSRKLEKTAWLCHPQDSIGSQTKPSLKLLLLALSAEADEDGIAAPGDAALMELTGMTKNTLNRLKQVLEAETWMDRIPGNGQGNKTYYILDVEWMERMAGVQGRAVLIEQARRQEEDAA